MAKMKTESSDALTCQIRKFLSWLARNNLMLYNPASELDLPRSEMTLPRDIFSPAEIDRIMDQPDVTTGFGIRNRAILETFYSTGIRRLEMIGLAVNDVDLDQGLLFVRLGKGNKDRVVPIGARACEWIDKYLHEVRPVYHCDDSIKTLFITKYGGPFNPDVMTRLVRSYFKKADIDSSSSCHALRHSMATSMLENGADIRYIQSMLGHVRLDTTQIYTRVTIVHLKKVHSRTHPARLKKDI